MTPDQIRTLRTRLSMTQQQLADHIGVCADSVRFWESGRRTPRKPAVKLMQMMEVMK